MKHRLVRWWMLYQAIAFLALIPIMSHHVIVEGQPKKILLFCIPVYAVLAYGSYRIYRALSKNPATQDGGSDAAWVLQGLRPCSKPCGGRRGAKTKLNRDIPRSAQSSLRDFAYLFRIE